MPVAVVPVAVAVVDLPVAVVEVRVAVVLVAEAVVLAHWRWCWSLCQAWACRPPWSMTL